ncbi:MAG TPA: RNA methyltransferase [Caldithrix abyssi]|uniref:RNA methyltransferase n=1 Tax=Caldithrix abyssi TaxID=187145 RepID=A0A7V5H3A1_CALAY|nr:RNA methyltransferase [Caldisericaceae bacterium]HHE55079.1 RNA methyltransferase [Caldithrix abyssi]
MQKISKNKLKWLRQLQQKKYRNQYRAYLISGLRAVQEALNSPQIRLKAILIVENHLHLMNELPAFHCNEIFSLNEKEFSQIVDEKTPQGIAVIAERPQLQLLTDKLPKRLLFVERVNDPGNLGTLLRSAAWFGWQTILLSPNSVDPYAPKTVRASAGTIAHLRLFEGITAQQIREIKKKNRHLLVASTVKERQPLEQFFPSNKEKIILALGSEAHGLSEEILAMSEHRLTISRSGVGESLNLAMAGTIFLYHFSLTGKLSVQEKIKNG